MRRRDQQSLHFTRFGLPTRPMIFSVDLDEVQIPRWQTNPVRAFPFAAALLSQPVANICHGNDFKKAGEGNRTLA